jgi:hypothetical protein
MDVDPVRRQLVEHERGQFGIQVAEQAGASMDERGAESAAHQVVHCLEPDEPATHDYGRGGRRSRVDQGGDAVDVVDGPQREGAPIRPWEFACAGTGGQDERIVGLEPGLAGRCVANLHGLRVAVDRGHLMEDPNVETETNGKRLRSLQEEVVPFRNHAAHEVGQAAVRAASTGWLQTSLPRRRR